MKTFARYAMGTILVLGVSSAWAQQRDLEVTMDVVPANVSAGAASEIKLPITLPPTASARARNPRPSAPAPQTWLAARPHLPAAASDQKEPKRPPPRTTTPTSRRHPALPDAPLP